MLPPYTLDLPMPAENELPQISSGIRLYGLHKVSFLTCGVLALIK